MITAWRSSLNTWSAPGYLLTPFVDRVSLTWPHRGSSPVTGPVPGHRAGNPTDRNPRHRPRQFESVPRLHVLRCRPAGDR